MQIASGQSFNTRSRCRESFIESSFMEDMKNMKTKRPSAEMYQTMASGELQHLF